jgi:CRP/FNR family transcriptional regulator, cyclic AMP receptor protein
LRDPDLSALHVTGWLADTPEPFRARVLSRCTLRTLGPGEALYHVGDEAGGLYGVVRGQVGVHGAPQGGSQTLFHIVGPGFWTGEFTTLTGKGRVISLIARTAAHVVRLHRADFQRIAEADPRAWRHFSLLAVQNTLRAVRVIDALRREDATERLAATLVNLAQEQPDSPVVLRLSQDDLGALSRLSRGSVNAALARLEGAGLLHRDYGAITLRDVAALDAYEAAD